MASKTREERKQELRLLPKEQIVELFKKAAGVRHDALTPNLSVPVMIEVILDHEYPLR